MSPRWRHCCLSSAPAAMSSHPSIVPRVVFNHVPPRLPWPPWSHEILGPPLLRKMKVDSERKTGSCAHAACNTRHNIMQQNACHALKQILDARKTDERTMHKGRKGQKLRLDRRSFPARRPVPRSRFSRSVMTRTASWSTVSLVNVDDDAPVCIATI